MRMNTAAQYETASPLELALRDIDYRVAEDAAVAWLMHPDYNELDTLSATLIERDARRLGHLLDVLLHLELCPEPLQERVYRVLDDLRDRIEIDHDQPASERWKSDRCFDVERLRERLGDGEVGVGAR
jgi:hypothetical protein